MPKVKARKADPEIVKKLYQRIPDLKRLSAATGLSVSELWQILGEPDEVRLATEPDPELTLQMEASAEQAKRVKTALQKAKKKGQPFSLRAAEASSGPALPMEEAIEPAAIVAVPAPSTGIEVITNSTVESAAMLAQKIQNKIEGMDAGQVDAHSLTSLVNALAVLVDKVQALRGLPKGYNATAVTYLDPDARKARIQALRKGMSDVRSE